jgi:hypothetical protein
LREHLEGVLTELFEKFEWMKFLDDNIDWCDAYKKLHKEGKLVCRNGRPTDPNLSAIVVIEKLKVGGYSNTTELADEVDAVINNAEANIFETIPLAGSGEHRVVKQLNRLRTIVTTRVRRTKQQLVGDGAASVAAPGEAAAGAASADQPSSLMKIGARVSAEYPGEGKVRERCFTCLSCVRLVETIHWLPRAHPSLAKSRWSRRRLTQPCCVFTGVWHSEKNRSGQEQSVCSLRRW